jgi:hypothetical protein
MLVEGTCLWTTQGKELSPRERAAEEVHQVTGRSLAQVNSRLFELAGTTYLSQVLHLQVSILLLLQCNKADPFATFCHEANIR